MEDGLNTQEPCYVFTPRGSASGGRPNKRRKLAGSHARKDEVSLPQLLDGRESTDLAARRLRIYQDLWSAQEQKLESVLKRANSETIVHVCEFLDEQLRERSHTQIPVGFITAGLATSSSGSTLSGIRESFGSDNGTVITSLSPTQCPNLKAALKSMIQAATNTGVDEEEDEDLTPQASREIRLLNYDLQLLRNHVLARSLHRVIIHFIDSEAFDGPVLSELVDVISCWLDRIPFVLIFEVATSVELFQEKLSRHALRLLKATVFEAKSSTEILDLLFRCATSPDETRFLWLGANTSKLLLDRQTEHIQSARGFVTAMQYMYMLHFYHNPLSILLCGVREVSLSKEHFAAIRDLPSFKRYINDLMDEEETGKANNLLKNDAYLLEHLEDRLQETRDSLNSMFYALEVLRTIYSLVTSKSNMTWSALYIKAMSGDLAESTAIRELSLSVKRLPSDTMVTLLEALTEIPTVEIQGTLTQLRKLINEQSDPTPLRTEHDDSISTIRTTVVAQKVSLSKSKATLSAQDAAYSKIVNQVDLMLREFLTRNIIFPKELILHEILVFDSKNACRDVVGPSPRQAIERALTSPHDYLACECCEGEAGLKPTQPAIAIVYQLYLESGALINVADMWAAFQAIMAPDGYEDNDENAPLQTNHQALFFRALAELKYLGMVRSSRKKADHIMKVRWKGL